LKKQEGKKEKTHPIKSTDEQHLIIIYLCSTQLNSAQLFSAL